LVGVVRIDDDRLRQLARRTGKLAQHQHAAFVVTRRDKFLGHQVHAIVQAAHHAEFSGTIVLVHGVWLMVSGQQDDRGQATKLGEPGVDSLD
jgi:hypothetical protein